jgi:serine/threonine protein kinase
VSAALIDTCHCDVIVLTRVISRRLSGGPIDTSKPYSEIDAKHVMQQLLSAVKLLHERGVIHRDIKPENIIRVSSSDLTVKLIDFGLATYLSASEVLYDWCGTPEFQGT